MLAHEAVHRPARGNRGWAKPHSDHPYEAAAVRSIPPPPDPTMTLRQAGLETSDGIVPEFAAALAAPRGSDDHRVGDHEPRRTLVLSHRELHPRRRRRAGGHAGANRRRTAGSRGHAHSHRGDGADGPTPRRDRFPGGAAGDWNLSLRGYAALLAMSDVLLEAQTVARLERRLAKGPPALTPDVLEAQLHRGIAGNDTRWAVTAGQVTMLRGLRPAQGQMAAGLGELVSAGLASQHGHAVYPSGAGDTLATMFAQLFSCGSVALSHVSGGVRGLVAFFSLFRSIAGLTTANIASDNAAMPDIEVIRSTQAGVVLTLRRLLENRAPGPELLYRATPPSGRRTAALLPATTTAAGPEMGTDACHSAERAAGLAGTKSGDAAHDSSSSPTAGPGNSGSERLGAGAKRARQSLVG